MLLKLQNSIIKFRRLCRLSNLVNSPARRHFVWIIIAVMFGFCIGYFFSQTVVSGIVFLRRPSLLTGHQVIENSSFQEIKLRYYEEQTRIHLLCHPQRRIGKSGDGGWDLCLFGAFDLRPPCLVYSFGVEFEWRFDETLAQEFGCVVRAFDPSMDMPKHIHRPGPVYFYPFGLANSNAVWKKKFVRHSNDFWKKTSADWNMKTLENLIAMNQDENKVIDVLKFDIEFSEWEVLERLLPTGILYRVKILLFETHTKEIIGRPTTKKDFLYYLSLMRHIENMGFRKYKTHFNNLGINVVRNVRHGLGQLTWPQYFTFKETCCYEQFYLNIRFLSI